MRRHALHATPFWAAVAAEAALRCGDRPALVDPDGTSLTYRGLRERSDEVAARLTVPPSATARWSA